MYDKETVYIVGHGKTGNDNAITGTFGIFFLGLVIDKKTDIVVDIDCTCTIDITSRFIKTLFLGKKIDRFYEELVEEIKNRYFGSSQKAIIVAYRDAYKKYSEIR